MKKTDKSNTTEIAKSESKEIVKKSKKTDTKGKVPRILTKKYTEKKLNHKFYKKIYIPDDKKFLESYFVQCEEKSKKGEILYSVPKTTKLSKKDGKRLKLICKEIKKQKFGIKLAPLIAIVVFVCAICVTVTLTKNIILRAVITNSCESIFQAKTDIDYLNLKFSDSSFTLKGLQIANKDEPMKNLIQIDSIVLDFEFSQLLKGRVIADELSVNGVATNTDRKTSGDLTAKRLAKLEKKRAKQAAKAAKKNNSEFMKNLKSKSDAALNVLTESVTGLFDKYNPQTIAENCYNQLQTPDVAKDVQSKAGEMVKKYQDVPKELEEEIKKVQATCEAASKINLEELKSDPVKIKEAVTTLTEAYNLIQEIKTKTEQKITMVQDDTATVKEISSDLQTAIKHDQNVVSEQISDLTSVSLDDLKNYVTDTFNNVGYAVLGKYYPYAVKAVNYLIELKNTNKSKEKKTKVKTETSTITERASGRTVHFATESAPKVWIKKISGSGVNFDFTGADISTDMDKSGKPATVLLNMEINKIHHKGNFVIDTRSYSESPLVNLDYECAGLPVSYPASNFGDYPGVPGLESADANLALNFKVYENQGFEIGGSGNLNNMSLTANSFEPEFIFNLLENTLSGINSVKLGITAGYTSADGVIMKLTTDADKKFMNSFSLALKNSMADVLADAKQKISEKISEYSAGASEKIGDFNEISSKVTEYSDYITSLSGKLEEKKAEAVKMLSDTAKSKVDEATNSAVNSAGSALKGLLKGKK
jgi:uncharacterized protein (TIGR03545 family)